MDLPDIPVTDSGYPTPRDDLPSSSRSNSPDSPKTPLTSTPVRGRQGRPLKDHFAKIRQDLSEIDSVDSIAENNSVLSTVKCVLAVSKDLKQKERANSALRNENETLREENESLREENTTLREESRRMEIMNASIHNEAPIIPKLQLDESEKSPSEVQIKKEPISFMTNDEEKSLLENKNIFQVESKPKVFTATATIQVETEKMDADIQTEDDNHVTEINANLQIELDQLQSEIEVREKTNNELKNRLFDFEQLKAKFEEDEKKLRSDLEKKLKASQEKNNRFEKKVEEMELRLKKKREELDEVRAENHRLVEDGKTHDFEKDEMSVQMQEEQKRRLESEKRVEKLTEEIAKLEEELERERSAKRELEKELENVREEHEKTRKDLITQMEEAVAKEASALEKLSEIQEENRKIVKENQYLSQAQQALLESEMNLKSEASVMNVNLRNAEQQLAILNEKLEVEIKNGKIKDAEIFDLELKNQELEGDQQNSQELLSELKRGKLEIDHLRAQLERNSHSSADVERLQRDFDELQKNSQLLEQRMQLNMMDKSEFDKKVEEFIRSEASKDVEIERLKKDLEENKSKVDELESCLREASQEVDKLKKENTELVDDFQDFKTHATLQYNDQVNIRDEEIMHLRERLVQLETYPGQTISVSKRHAEAQTDAVSEEREEEKSPNITLVSEEDAPIQGASELERVEGGIRQFIAIVTKETCGQRIANLPKGLRSETTPFTRCADAFLEIADILDVILAQKEAPEEQIRECWNGHLKLMEDAEARLKNESDALSMQLREKLEDEERKWRKAVEDLGNELSMEKRHHGDMRTIAEGFKEQFELEVQEKEAFKSEYEELDRYCSRLRSDLEQAQHCIQQEKRASSRKSEEIDEERIALENSLQMTENELRNKIKKVAELENELVDVKRRRVYDRETLDKMNVALEMMKNKCEYWRKRNSQRQKLIEYMNQKVQAIMPSSTLKSLQEMQTKLQLSGLAEEETEELSNERSQFYRGGENDHEERRVLRNNNRP